MEQLCACRENQSEYGPGPGLLLHGQHKESPRKKDQGMYKIIATDLQKHDMIEVKRIRVVDR